MRRSEAATVIRAVKVINKSLERIEKIVRKVTFREHQSGWQVFQALYRLDRDEREPTAVPE